MRSTALSYRHVSCVMCCGPVSLSGCLVCVHDFIYVLLLFLSAMCLYLELLCSGLVYHRGLVITCLCLYVRSYINSKSVTHLWTRAELNLIGNLITRICCLKLLRLFYFLFVYWQEKIYIPKHDKMRFLLVLMSNGTQFIISKPLTKKRSLSLVYSGPCKYLTPRFLSVNDEFIPNKLAWKSIFNQLVLRQ